MNLDELIEQLQELRRTYPASATAIVCRPANLKAIDITYEHGQVLIGAAPQPQRW